MQLSTGGSTLDLLASATYQVGVSTTALFEGMALGCRTAVANLPGHEYLEPAIAQGHALLMTRPSQLTSAPLCTDPATYYAPATASSAPRRISLADQQMRGSPPWLTVANPQAGGSASQMGAARRGYG